MLNRFLPAKLMLAFVNQGFGKFIVEAARRGGARGGTKFSARTLRKDSTGADEKNEFCNQDVVLILMLDETENVVASVAKEVAVSPDPIEGAAMIIDAPKTFIRPGVFYATTKGDTMKSSSMMIVSITNHGEAESLMQIARDAGARGGTIINARGTGTEDDLRYFGVSLVPEKEVLLVICDAERADNVLEKLGSQPLFSEPGGGIVFAAPVEKFMPLKSN